MHYSIFVLSCNIFCVLVVQCITGIHCRNVAASRSYRMSLSGISAGTLLSKTFHIASAIAGLSALRSKRSGIKRKRVDSCIAHG